MKKRVPQLDTTGFKFAKNPKVKRGKRTPSPDSEKPVVPILLKWDEFLGHMRWKVQDSAAWTNIREELLARQGGKCAAKCGVVIYIDFSELNHKRGRGMGGSKRCDCPDCTELLCKDTILGDGTLRKGCHTLVHEAGDLRTDFARGAEAVSE
jgi:hypothetical protein